MWRCTLTAVLSASAVSLAGAQGDVKLTVDTGYDSNVRRDYDQTPTGTVSDAVLSALGSAAGQVRGEPGQAFGTYDVGLRKFVQYPSEDTLVQAANLEGSLPLSAALSLGTEGHGKDRRGGDRDYSDLIGDVFVDYAPDPAVSLRLRAGGHRFVYWDNFSYSFAAPEGGLSGRYRFNRRHAVLFSADVGLRTYNSLADSDPNQPPPAVDPTRRDTAFSVTVGYTYRGPFTASVLYDYFEQDSNSFGESFGRHRLSVNAAVRLPWRLFLLAEGALQYTHYPDGIFLSADLLLAQDEENSNALSLKLARPLDDHVDVEAHYGIYYNRLPTNSLTYLRQVGWVGLTWRL